MMSAEAILAITLVTYQNPEKEYKIINKNKIILILAIIPLEKTKQIPIITRIQPFIKSYRFLYIDNKMGTKRSVLRDYKRVDFC